MKWRWKSWDGAKRTFEAHSVEFADGHVVFFNADEEVLLAIRNDDCIDLHPVLVKRGIEDRNDPKWWGKSMARGEES